MVYSRKKGRMRNFKGGTIAVVDPTQKMKTDVIDAKRLKLATQYNPSASFIERMVYICCNLRDQNVVDLIQEEMKKKIKNMVANKFI